MAILAETTEYLVEFEDDLLTIARYSDGNCVAFKGPRVSDGFQDCVNKYGAERTIATYLRAAGDNWQPLYNPKRMTRTIL